MKWLIKGNPIIFIDWIIIGLIELFQAKMDTIKDRSSMDLTEAEDIKRWQEYTEELYKKDLHDPDNHHGVITHLRMRHPGMWSQVGLRKHH